MGRTGPFVGGPALFEEFRSVIRCANRNQSADSMTRSADRFDGTKPATRGLYFPP
jgi:hypothetical protein